MKTKHSNLLKLLAPLIAIVHLCSCNKDDVPGQNKEIQVSANTRDTIVYVNVDNDQVPVILSIPESAEPMPAVVVMHGSGGLWKDDDPNTGEPSRQFEEWCQILTQNGFVCALVGSYVPRGTPERKGKYKDPPYAFRISGEFVRPRDAYATLEMLRGLHNPDGSKVVRGKDAGILGFSHGGNAVAATLYDTSLTPKDWKWTQSFDGKDYDTSSGVRAPANKPEDGGFAAGVIYYGGSVAHGYWGGDPCSDDAMDEIIYGPYAPLRHNIAEDGYLAENTICLYELLKAKGFPVETKIYKDVGHGFDDDGLKQSEEAREDTMNFFKKYLNEVD
ncbi:dienelactone hydrolase family protein [Flagellimonas flava]|uniref:dienelactone hydrolase family protein n=1 Tax=Flagellimonas flava TaxID=570519 RepID=UPI003D65C7A3